jgi:hypothetical protein
MTLTETMLNGLMIKDRRIDKEGNIWEKCPATTDKGKKSFLFCRNALGENKHLWVVWNWKYQTWLVNSESRWNGHDWVYDIQIKVNSADEGLTVARELIKKSKEQ